VKIRTINPTTGELLREYPAHSPGEAKAIVEAVGKAASRWAGVDVKQRAELVGRAGQALRRKQHDLAVLVTREMGKPLSQSMAEIEKCAWVCDYYAENGPSFLADEVFHTEALHSCAVF